MADKPTHAPQVDPESQHPFDAGIPPEQPIKSLSFSGVKKSLGKQLFGKKHPWAEVVHLLVAVTLESKEQAEPLSQPLATEQADALTAAIRSDLKQQLKLPDFLTLYSPAVPYPLDVLINTRIEVDLWTAALVSQLHPERLKDFDFTPMDADNVSVPSDSEQSSREIKVGSPILLNQFPSVGLLALPVYLIGQPEQTKKWAKQITKAKPDISDTTLALLNQSFGFDNTLFSCGFIPHNNLHQQMEELFGTLPVQMADSHLRHGIEDVMFITNHVFVFLYEKEIFLPMIDESHWSQFQGAVNFSEYLAEIEYTQQLFSLSQFKLREMRATPAMFGNDEAAQMQALKEATKNPMGLILPD